MIKNAMLKSIIRKLITALQNSIGDRGTESKVEEMKKDVDKEWNRRANK